MDCASESTNRCFMCSVCSTTYTWTGVGTTSSNPSQKTRPSLDLDAKGSLDMCLCVCCLSTGHRQCQGAGRHADITPFVQDQYSPLYKGVGGGGFVRAIQMLQT